MDSSAVKAFSYADFPIELRPHARYRLHKFHALRSGVIERGILAPSQVLTAPDIEESLLLLAHSPLYVAAVRDGTMSEANERELGFRWSPALMVRGKRIVGGTLGACRSALGTGLGIALGGGAHHAFHDRGRGFCIFNDVMVAARALREEGESRRVAVLDCDVHQGDGTASIASGDSRVFTFSVHGEKNYPFEKQRSSLDIALPDHAGDAEYLEAVASGLSACLALPDLDLLIYIAGSDPYIEDTLGRLDVSAEGLAERDRLVLEAAFRHGLPVAVLMGGGYCDPIEKTVELQISTVKTAMDLWKSSRALRTSHRI